MKTATLELKSITPTKFSRFHQTDKEEKELPDAYERRTWPNKAHFNIDNYVIIPGIMFANCFRESAKFMSLQIPGKGKATYTKHFDAGIMITDDINTGVKK